MKRLVFLAILLSFPLGAPNANAEQNWLSEREIRQILVESAVGGRYMDGVKFAESFSRDGTTDYLDNYQYAKGKWEISGSVLCTFYPDVDGGCFLIAKQSTNCYALYFAGETMAKALTNLGSEKRERAHFWRSEQPGTCNLDEQVT